MENRRKGDRRLTQHFKQHTKKVDNQIGIRNADELKSVGKNASNILKGNCLADLDYRALNTCPSIVSLLSTWSTSMSFYDNHKTRFNVQLNF